MFLFCVLELDHFTSLKRPVQNSGEEDVPGYWPVRQSSKYLYSVNIQ